MTRQEYEEQRDALAEQNYAKHQIIEGASRFEAGMAALPYAAAENASGGEGSLRVWLQIHAARPGEGFFWAEVALVATRLVIVGDGPDIILCGSGTRSLEGAIRWVAASHLDYLATKIYAGEAKEWDHDVAMDDVRQHISDLATDDDEPANDPLVARWEDALDDDLRRAETRDEFIRACCEVEQDAYEYSFGEVYTHDLANARALCRRLVELLDEMKGEVVG